MAFLSAYHPQKSKDFVKLDRLRVSDTKPIAKANDWKEQLAKVQAWAGRTNRKTS